MNGSGALGGGVDTARPALQIRQPTIKGGGPLRDDPIAFNVYAVSPLIMPRLHARCNRQKLKPSEGTLLWAQLSKRTPP